MAKPADIPDYLLVPLAINAQEDAWAVQKFAEVFDLDPEAVEAALVKAFADEEDDLDEPRHH